MSEHVSSANVFSVTDADPPVTETQNNQIIEQDIDHNIDHNNDQVVDPTIDDTYDHEQSVQNSETESDNLSTVEDTHDLIDNTNNRTLHNISGDSDKSVDTDGDFRNVDISDLGAQLQRCDHYSRGCHLIFPCCDEVFACRMCHDAEKNHHTMKPQDMHDADRKAVVTMLCRYCLEPQPINDSCTNCQRCMGTYFCKICKFLDLVDKGQFHCDECGICRIGGKDNYMHCDMCGLCVAKSEEHKCARKIEGDCPVCCLKLFDTPDQTITNLKCGHWMHTLCFRNYVKHNYICPLCSKSLIDNSQMNAYMDQKIAATPMPEEYKDKMVNILCNDCGAKNLVNFHFFGLKCPECSGYNTKQIKID